MTHPRAPRRAASAAGLLLWIALCTPAGAQQVKGPTTCFKCHKLARQAWETKAPFHKTSTQQLTAEKAGKYAAAIQLPSPTTVRGRGDCVSCHATIVAGAPSAGVSCESCHGASSGYYVPHQEPEFYALPEAQWQGLRNLYDEPAAIAQMCVDCHVTPDPRLAAAGHPDGRKFDPGAGLAKMEHWPSGDSTVRVRAYGPPLYAQVATEGRARAARRLASGGGSGPAAKPAAGRPAPRPPATAAAAPAAPTAQTPALSASSATVPPRPRPAAAPANTFDWDEPVPELPPDYPGEPAAGRAGSPPAVPADAPAAVAPAPAAPLVPTAPPRPPRARIPSTAPDVPPLPVEPVAPPPPPPGATAAARVRPPAADVAEVRGQGAALLAGMLKAKRGTLDVPPPAPPAEFRGPDGELLRLQDEILYLVLETLRKPQP